MKIKSALGALALSLVAVAGYGRSTGTFRTTAESAHFLITAERGRGEVGMEAAARLEDAYSKLTHFFDFTPAEKINAVLVDDIDYSNGFAYSPNSWIVLYLPPSRLELRGSTAWLPNVATHELAHVITLRKMGVTSRFLGVEAFASLGFSRARTDASVRWAPNDVPPWLAEGLAQYASMHCGFDTLDTRRTMLLRQAWRDGALIPLKAMEDFSGDGRAGEAIYNQGFHIVDFLYRTQGRDAVNAMLKAWDAHGYHGAFERAFGISPETVYAKWKEELNRTFADSWGLPDRTLGGMGGVYRVETAPVQDTDRDILYFLSSDPNDFGITHLYARRGKKTRLVYRNVEATPQLTEDGSLLFASIRTELSTGAQTGDLYRYLPDANRVKRITRNQRAFAGVEAGDDVFALLYHNGRTRLARLVDGKPDRWVDAPAGAEFSSVTASGDSVLWLSVVRGNNSDIFKLVLRTGILAPFEASTYNEIDPQIRGGRVYFSSDRSGEYAVYSREAGVLRRHTPAGVSAFHPFMDGDSLWYSAYKSEGFRLASAPVSDVDLVDVPADTANRPFPAPEKISLKNLKRDAAGMEWVGYFATLGYALTPSVDVSNFYGSTETFTLNPCEQHAYAGGGSLWTDPAERSALSVDFLAAHCLEGTGQGSLYLPAASVAYISRNFTPDLIFQAQYQSLQAGRDFGHKYVIGTVHQFQLATAAQYYLGDYFSNTGFAQIAGTVADLREGESGGDAGISIGNTFAFAVLEPGVDYINQGLFADATVLFGSGAAAFGGDAGLFGNVQRTLFLGAQINALQTTEGADTFDGGFLLSADTRLPLGYTLGTAGYRGMFLESVFFRTAYSRRWNTASGIGLTTGNDFRPFSYPQYRRYGAAPVSQVQTLTPQAIRLGLRLKLISPGSRTVYWDASWEAPPSGFKDGYFSLSLTL